MNINYDEIVLVKYLDVNIFRLMICPNCKTKNRYERSVIKDIVTKRDLDSFETYTSNLDSGSSWECLTCGLSIVQDGSWEIRDQKNLVSKSSLGKQDNQSLQAGEIK